MGRAIQLTRNELVWQTRIASWDDQDYQRHLEWLKTFKDRVENEPESYNKKWYQSKAAEYDFLSQYTWEQVCDYISGNFEGEEPYIEHTNTYTDGTSWTYKDFISDLIKDAIREDCYDSDIVNEDYADDYDEEWDDVPHTEESEAENDDE